MIRRKKTKVVKIGTVKIGGSNPIAIQSMTKTKTSDVKSTVKEIHRLEKAGCDLIRVAVLEEQDANALCAIKHSIKIPLIADIHFDYRLALAAVEAGVDKIRINPGTMRRRDHIRQIALACRKKHIPIRVGGNSGSLVSTKKPASIPKSLASSARCFVRFLNSLQFNDLVISLKASDVIYTIEANRLFSKHSNLPIHLGVTACGSGDEAIVKSTACISVLLAEGIGDTIRISLTDDSLREVEVAKEILYSLELRKREYDIISCPTCGRTDIDVIGMERRVRKELAKRRLRFPKRGYKIAIMGCVVNGPGEARDADLGITGGRGFGFIFKKGKLIRKVPKKNMLKTFLKEIEKCAGRIR